MTTVTYVSSTPYIGNRPWADVVLNPTSGSGALKCLADTGADYLQVNHADAMAAGLSGPLASATATGTLTAGGSTLSLLFIVGVVVDIEGVRVTVDLLVDPTNSTAPPIAGRQVLLKAFDIGFDKKQWHY